MLTKRANNYGFCFGVKRAIRLAERNKNSVTIGPLIHNQKEIDRLKVSFSVGVENDISNIQEKDNVIIRTHGIPKKDFSALKGKNANVIDATCPFVQKPQQICERMSKDGYEIVIFGDPNHPEIKSVMSYCVKPPQVVLKSEELKGFSPKSRVAIVSQTTKDVRDFLDVASYLIQRCAEVRVFNTICNATYDNQESARNLSKEVDIMIIIGGRHSSNTKQLLTISLQHCKDSYLIEDKNDLLKEWFIGKNMCGITAGASTPDWIINEVEEVIKTF